MYLKEKLLLCWFLCKRSQPKPLIEADAVWKWLNFCSYSGLWQNVVLNYQLWRAEVAGKTLIPWTAQDWGLMDVMKRYALNSSQQVAIASFGLCIELIGVSRERRFMSWALLEKPLAEGHPCAPTAQPAPQTCPFSHSMAPHARDAQWPKGS